MGGVWLLLQLNLEEAAPAPSGPPARLRGGIQVDPLTGGFQPDPLTGGVSGDEC